MPADRLEHYKAAGISGRLGRPDEVADAIVALLGLRGTWTTGAVLDINGGMT